MESNLDDSLRPDRQTKPVGGANLAAILGISIILNSGFTCRETVVSQPEILENKQSPDKGQTTRVSKSFIKKSLWKHSATQPYSTATLSQTHALSRAVQFAAAMQDLSKIDSLRAIAKEAGFHVQRWQVGEHLLLALLESPSTFSGLGAYVFRVSPNLSSRPLLLQAPHSYFDEGTGMLALTAFLQDPPNTPPARALFVNTKHRYIGEDGIKKRREFNPADVCHNSSHPYNLATEAFARAHANLRVIQLHGFSTRKHEAIESTTKAEHSKQPPSGTAKSNDRIDNRGQVILSAGENYRPPSDIRSLRNELKKRIDFQFLLFPEDTKQLGATSNVQGRLLRHYPDALFVHIEMSKEARKSLKRDASQTTVFSLELLKTGLNSG